MLWGSERGRGGVWGMGCVGDEEEDKWQQMLVRIQGKSTAASTLLVRMWGKSTTSTLLVGV